MKKKAFTNICILTILAILFSSFLLITVGGPVRSNPGTGIKCKVWPDSTAARLEHCPTCPFSTLDTNAYCGKNDCSCANWACYYWSQRPLEEACESISVCGAVCNSDVDMEYCILTPQSPTAETALKNILTCPCGFCPTGTKCGTGGPGANCTHDVNCTYWVKYNEGGCVDRNNQEIQFNYNPSNPTRMGICKYSDKGEHCAYDPEDLSSSDEECFHGSSPLEQYICCKNKLCIYPSDIDRNCAVNIIDITLAAKSFGTKVS